MSAYWRRGLIGRGGLIELLGYLEKQEERGI